jgi:hypothetical protein
VTRNRVAAVCEAAEGGNQFQRVAEHIQVLAIFARSLPSIAFTLSPCLPVFQ